jgi:2-polyprenyl-3-methyl-5-hydroxy-6-metoxy-1,4-benzoquinol methylase
MEVLEHIKDREDGTFHCFDFSGVNNFLSECLRVLKPGGIMFLTTPNAHNLTNLVRILEGNTPMFFRPHVREYGANEVADMLTQAGFKIKAKKTINVWKELAQDKFIWLKGIAESCGSDISMMNNDTFILATK